MMDGVAMDIAETCHLTYDTLAESQLTSNGSACRLEGLLVSSVNDQNNAVCRNGVAVPQLHGSKEDSRLCLVLPFLCAHLTSNGALLFPPSVSKHLSIFSATCFPLHLCLTHFQQTLARYAWHSERLRDSPDSFVHNQQSSLFLMKQQGFSQPENPQAFFFSVLGSFSLPKPPKSDI